MKTFKCPQCGESKPVDTAIQMPNNISGLDAKELPEDWCFICALKELLKTVSRMKGE